MFDFITNGLKLKLEREERERLQHQRRLDEELRQAQEREREFQRQQAIREQEQRRLKEHQEQCRIEEGRRAARSLYALPSAESYRRQQKSSGAATITEVIMDGHDRQVGYVMEPASGYAGRIKRIIKIGDLEIPVFMGPDE